MLRWPPIKDAIQLIVFIVGATLIYSNLEASNALNTANLAALQEIQREQGGQIKALELKQAEQDGYDKAWKERKETGG